MANYLHMALWLVLFYDALVMLALPSTVTYIAGTDGSAGRFICYLTAIIIAGDALYRSGFKRLPIISLGLLLFFIIFSSFHCPNIQFDSTFIPKDPGLFNFKPMLECLLYFGLFMGVYSTPINPSQVNKIYKTLGIAGVVFSGYIILQKMGMDQIYRLTDGMSIDQMSRNPQVGGFISQPVYAGAILIMLIPFMVRLKSWFAPLGAVAIFLTGNRSAMVAIAILSLYLILDRREIAIWVFVAYMVILALAMAIYWVHPGHMDALITSDGRLDNWKLIIKDMIFPAFPGIDKSYVVTGQGIGGFPIFFPFYNHSNFYQAHNEYLELWRGCSFIGLFLFFKAQFSILNKIYNRFVFSSLLGISILACTNPVWHIPTLAFMTAFLVGLGLNLSDTHNKPEVSL